MREFIEDVALEISQANNWRELLFKADFDEKILISKNSFTQLPHYIKNSIEENDLQFYVSKVKICEEYFDEGSRIFKFEAISFPDIIRYTGN